MKDSYKFLLICLVVLQASSCKVWNPNQIFRLSKGEGEISVNEPNSYSAYSIGPGDLLDVSVFSNDGYKLVDGGLAQTVTAFSQSSDAGYVVDPSGFVRLPQIDTVKLIGLTIPEAERLLESRYAKHVVDPFVQVRVMNRQVLVFRGDDLATVVPIENERTTLMQVLAASGGVPPTGKAYKIKLVRLIDGERKIAMFDLRDPSHLENSDVIMQANDIVIIDPTFETTFIQQLTPLFAFVTSVAAIYAIVISLNNN